MGTSAAWVAQSKPGPEGKAKELLNVIRACAGRSIDVTAAKAWVTPGSDINVTATVVNRSDYPLRLEAVGSPYASPSTPATISTIPIILIAFMSPPPLGKKIRLKP